MTQYLIRSRHRAIRGWSYAMQDCPQPHRETLDTDQQMIVVVPDGMSMRLAIALYEAMEGGELASKPKPLPTEGTPWPINP